MIHHHHGPSSHLPLSLSLSPHSFSHSFYFSVLPHPPKTATFFTPKHKKMAPSSISHFTPTTFIYLLLLSLTSTPILGINITNLLPTHSDFSDFANLLTTSAVAADLTHISSVTILAVPNTFLRSSELTNHHHSPATLADVLRHHVLLEYLSWPDLRQIPPAGKLITTLYQTTGRATGNSGELNFTRNPITNTVTARSPAGDNPPTNTTILSLITTVPYNLTIFSVDSIIFPSGFDLMASETKPTLGLNITKALIDGHNFNVAASILMASGVVEEFEAYEGGAGITLFMPTDDAFSNLPANVNFQSLPADQKAVVMKFHVLHSYYPLGSLESIVNPVQPTLATEDMGAGRFTLNISRVNGSLAINTGIVQGTVTQTVFDENPVAIFGVSKVLLPRETFGNNPVEKKSSDGVSGGGAQPPEVALSPENSYGQPSRLLSPPGFLGSEAVENGVQRTSFVLFCIGLYLFIII